MSLTGQQGTQLSAIQFVPSGYQVATGGNSNSISFWDLRKQARICIVPAHQKMVSDIKFETGTSQGRLMLTTSYDCDLKIYGTKCVMQGENTCDDWIPLRTMKGHDNKVTSVSMTKDLSTIITTSFDKCFKLWNVVKGEK